MAAQKIFNYDVFLSHSRQDMLTAQFIYDALVRNGFTVWWDVNSIDVGEDWDKAIVDGLNEAQTLVLLMSSSSLRSEFVLREYQFFLDKNKQILPILLDRNTEIPSSLHRFQFLNISDGIDDTKIERLIRALAKFLGREVKTVILSSSAEKGSIDTSAPETEFSIPSKEALPPIPDSPDDDKPATTDSKDTAPSDEATTDEQSQINVPLSAISDKWAEKDLLGYEKYAKALAGFILNNKTEKPLTIGIYAEWGGGKSTLMHLLEEALKKQKADELKQNPKSAEKILGQSSKKVPLHTVWFNAWKYDDEEALWAALALEVSQQVKAQSGFFQRLRLRTANFDGLKLLKAALKQFAYFALITILAMLGVVILALWQGWALVEIQNELAASLALGGALTLWKYGKDFMDKSKELLGLDLADYLAKEPDYAAKIGFLSEFEKHFQNFVKIVTNNHRETLVIFIDDLDRCSVPKAADLVEAINLFLSTEGCVFIIGMDRRTVAASIEVKYDKLQNFLKKDNEKQVPILGERFLEKIIQINFPIPRPNPEIMKNFVLANLGQAIVEKQDEEKIEEKAQFIRDKVFIDTSYTSVKQIQVNINNAAPNVIGNETEKQQQEQAEQRVLGEIILKDFDNLTEVKDVVMEMLALLEFNPRRIKRFINVFRLQSYIAVEQGQLTSPNKLTVLGTLLEIAFKWPEFAACMIINPLLDDDLFRVHKELQSIQQQSKDLKLKEKAFSDLLKDRAIYPLERQPTTSQYSQILQFIDESELIARLPKTKVFSDDDVRRILSIAVQITGSTIVRS